MTTGKKGNMSIQSFSLKFKDHKIIKLILDKETQTQLLRYLISGFTAFGTEYLLFATLYSYAGISSGISNSIAMAAGFIISFTLNRKWSFKSKENLIKQLLMFGALFGINLFISNNAIKILSGTFRISPLFSKLIIMCAIVLWNFVIYRKLIYRN
ncbi:hypothetical protein CDQ84_14255 [Clostridium thermosuccinogenes]|jgi:putative flippase GtrA|uniref:GtrA/DPMS transmembrane domain-containing protein n=1 Tax=Clostridium thermosuccinogenes TaxID=84032 RepID=A0A2K2FDL8_9CLOT|nr:GtrA family protein [Pseudoclostridium thermosuccinogenes]AUS96395.1 hypothetical protein CDO33_08095 [Pseudoclostridium thermosuccinogenes]PNT92939.1 hypothetical protein CDQ83_05140 [Pseudoclostridium thermosuccinogenes]PNT95655.1 hypothetical protein CDQ85_14125 [Pseudoclostridium thermosuccinogenes]PNT96878.1 hypothetical protein CDQ84_14255 [Pseudoclostridium thermosuccinogenes]